MQIGIAIDLISYYKLIILFNLIIFILVIINRFWKILKYSEKVDFKNSKVKNLSIKNIKNNRWKNLIVFMIVIILISK